MARISGVNLPTNKRAEVALTYIYGIGRVGAQKILKEAGVDPNVRIKDLKEEEINNLRTIVEKKCVTEGELKRQITANVRRLKEINCYRGVRHAKRLPVRGQRTKTNSRTGRGNRRVTVGSGRRSAAQKT